MKSTVETLEPTKVRLTVEIPVEELKSEMDKAYKSIANQVSIPGFRKGHVPARIIDQRFGRAAVIEQVVNEVLPGQYSAAVSEHELRPMSQPDVEVTEIPSTSGELTGQVVFTAEVDVVPSFELPEYGKDTVIEVDSVEVTDEDVQAELDALRGRFASLKPIKRQAKTGDFTTIDLVATINGEEVDSVSDVSSEIGSGTVLDGQDAALRKPHAGDVVTFTSTLKGGEHEGEEAEVTITVKSVKERELPEADDDFAQMVSEFDTIDELMEDLKKQAAQTKTSQQARQARDRLVDELLRAAIEKEYRTEILAEELAKKNEVQVGQQELFDYAIQMSQNYGMDINRLFSDPQQISAVVADLGRAKALIEVLREVTVKDTEGNPVDLSEFLGLEDEAAAEEAAAETVAEVEKAGEELAEEK